MESALREALVIGALLHDIGKFIYRGFYEDFREFRHQELGKLWAQERGLSEPVQAIIERHHRLRRSDPKYGQLSVDAYDGSPLVANLIRLVDFADNVASAMERESPDDTVDTQYDQAAPLGCILSEISLSGAKTFSQWVWQLKPADEFPYPVERGQFRAHSYAYKELWDRFNKEFGALLNVAPPSGLPEENVLMLLEKYTTQMPEYTRVAEGRTPNTSLFHHLKTTAAVALANFLYISDELNVREAAWGSAVQEEHIYKYDEPRFLLVALDISGIQNFIYNVGSDKALKAVRGRSFYLELLLQALTDNLLDKLNLSRACVVYRAGGGSVVLAPNTKKAAETLKEVINTSNEWLFDNFGLALYVAHATEPLTADDLSGKSGNLSSAWVNLRSKLAEAKRQKWSDLLVSSFEAVFAPQSITHECSVCGKESPEDSDICPNCQDMIDLGARLADCPSLYEVSDPAYADISILGRYYGFSRPDQAAVVREFHLKELWSADRAWAVRNLPSGVAVAEKELSKLAASSCGAVRLGVLRADVDNMGLIFAKGLGDKSTFARLSDLSQRFEHYFKYYVPHLLSGCTDSPITAIQRIAPLPVNVIYAGGDDLFLIGSWDAALDAVGALVNDFCRFSARNPDVTMSAGFVVADERWAFYRLADAAGEAEERAKNAGRNALTFFGTTLKWNKVLRADDSANTVAGLVHLFVRNIRFEKGQLHEVPFSKGFVQRIRTTAEQWANNTKERRYIALPALYYIFAREMKSHPSQRDWLTVVFSEVVREQVLEELAMPALDILDLMLRGGGASE